MLSPRYISVQGFNVSPRLVAVQGLWPPPRRGSAGRWSPYARHDDVFNLPVEDRALLPVLSGEELASLLAEADRSSVAALLSSVAAEGVPEQVFLNSIGVPRAHLVALFEAHGPQIEVDASLLSSLLVLVASEQRFNDTRLRLALLMAAAILMWD